MECKVIMMLENFVRERITQLRLEKGVSEYQLGYGLGHSRGYIYNISSGKSLQPMKELSAICDYLGITPQQFFDNDTAHPELLQQTVQKRKGLSAEDLRLIQAIVDRMVKPTRELRLFQWQTPAEMFRYPLHFFGQYAMIQ